MTELARYIEGLTISQGAGLAEPFALLPWERRFVRRAFRPGVQTFTAEAMAGASTQPTKKRRNRR